MVVIKYMMEHLQEIKLIDEELQLNYLENEEIKVISENDLEKSNIYLKKITI